MNFENECFCITARGLANRLTQLYDQRLESCGLKVTQYSVIKKIVKQPEITVSELATQCQLDRTTLTRNLHVLEKNGWIDFTEGFDKRQKRVRLRSEKANAFQAACATWAQLQDELNTVVNLDSIRISDQQITEKLKGQTK
jgi:DNA-binding MarR family transcriptional regulator